VPLDAAQKEKLVALLAQEHVAVLVTQGEKWPTANLQAFAETPEFDLLFISGLSPYLDAQRGHPLPRHGSCPAPLLRQPRGKP
jgi:hypothetical protein